MGKSAFLLVVSLFAATESLSMSAYKSIPKKPPPSRFRPEIRLSKNPMKSLFPEKSTACKASLATSYTGPMSPRAGPVTLSFKPTLYKYYYAYLNALETKPFSTTCISAAVINSVGSILSQCIRSVVTKTSLSLNFVQVGAFLLTGLLFKGPYYHSWYNLLARLSRTFSEKGKIAFKLGVDQTLGVMLFYPAYFYVYELLLSAVSFRLPLMQVAHATCVANLPSVIQANYLIWPAFQYMNFKHVPASLRVIATSLMAVVWNCYFCARVV